jgi:hypothetical protein
MPGTKARSQQTKLPVSFSLYQQGDHLPEPRTGPKQNTQIADKTKTPQKQGCSILSALKKQCNACYNLPAER